MQRSEQFLDKLLEPAGECNTFDDLLYHLYMNERKTISELPPPSVSMMGHMLRSSYFVYIHLSLYDPLQSVASKRVVMVNANVDEWKRNVQSFVPVVAPAATVVRSVTCKFHLPMTSFFMTRDQEMLLFIG